MIHIIRKLLVLLKDHLNYLKDNIFECIFKKRNRLLFFKTIIFFSKYIIMESLSPEEENIIKDIKNLFRLKLRIECSKILRIFLSIKKKKKIIISQ